MTIQVGDSERLLIVGASTRAAAFSAQRAGLSPVCADLFADRDLLGCCPVARLSAAEFPHGLERLARTAAIGPWLYVGALENYPQLVGRISSRRPLWGNGSDVLRRVRDPLQLAGCLEKACLPCPEVRSISPAVAEDASWLIKPIASAGGRGIREFAGWDSALERRAAPGSYFQRRIPGVSCAAVFVGDGRRAALIGLTRQLVGESSFHAKPFHYCGSIGPLPLESRLQEQLIRLGDTLAGEFGLMGLFGVDGMLVDSAFWTIEVNPRYTASVEVLEFGLGVSAMALHRDACTYRPLNWNGADRTDGSGKFFGKAILYAARCIHVPDSLAAFSAPLDRSSDGWRVPCIADIPNEGEQIEAGRPICTVFAIESSLDACHEALSHAACRVYGVLEQSTVANSQFN